MARAENEAITAVVLLSHHPGDEYWSARALDIEGCVADGETPEEAAQNISQVIRDFIEDDLGRLKILENPPEYLLTQVKINAQS